MTEAPTLDVAADLVRRQDADARRAVDAAYRAVFASPAGQIVLLHLTRAAVQNAGPDLTSEQRTYHQARTDTVLAIAAKAGFDALSLAGAILTGTIEGKDHGRSNGNDGRRGPVLDDGDREF